LKGNNTLPEKERKKFALRGKREKDENILVRALRSPQQGASVIYGKEKKSLFR